MKMIMLVVDDSHKEALEAALDRAGVAGYTELHASAGRGSTGPRLGSRGFPGTSAVVISVVAAEEVETLRARLIELCEAPGLHLKAYVWGVEPLVFQA